MATLAHSTSRRAFLRSAAGASAALASIPATALACAEVCAHPDAELIRLGEEHDRLRAALVVVWHEWRHLEDEAGDAFKAVGGGDYKAWFAFRATHPAEAAGERMEGAANVLEEVDRAIRASKPQTLAGWLVRLRVERDEQTPIWEAGKPLDDLDWPLACLGRLYDDLAASIAKAGRA